jgi:hypothetical protein
MIRHAVRKPWDNAASIAGEGVLTVGLDEKTNALMVPAHVRNLRRLLIQFSVLSV